MRLSRPLAAAALLLLALPLAAQERDRASAGIARLERQRAANPRAANVLRALGIAYYKAGRHADALPVLQEARRLAPKDGTAALYAGMSAEATGDLTAAREAYTSYLRYGRTARVRRQLEARLAALTRRELAHAAKRAVAGEQELAQVKGSPYTVAVMPLAFHGSDSTLRPLGRGLSELMITDLSRARALTVVERAQVQALMDEIALSQDGRVDAATEVRAGRLVQAGRVVQGAITQLPSQTLRVDAAVVDVPTTNALGGASASDELEQIFAMEKKIVLDVLAALGVTLSPAERAAIEQRPTRSLAAFLAYSRGLEAEDRGDLEAARQHYQEAARLDPSFSAAQERATVVTAAITGSEITPQTIETQLTGTVEGTITTSAVQGNATTDAGTTSTVTSIAGGLVQSVAQTTETGVATPVQNKDDSSSTTGTDRPASGTATVRIIIRQPTP